MNFLLYVQIIFELLPVSSSAHVSLFSDLFNEVVPATHILILSHIPTLLILVIYLFFCYRNDGTTFIPRNLFLDLLFSICISFSTGILFLLKKIMIPECFLIPYWYSFLLTALCICTIHYLLSYHGFLEKYRVGDFLIIPLIAFLGSFFSISRFAIVLMACLIRGLSEKKSLYITLLSAVTTMFGGICAVLFSHGVNSVFEFCASFYEFFMLVLVAVISIILFFGFLELYQNKKIWPIALYLSGVSVVGWWIR